MENQDEGWVELEVWKPHPEKQGTLVLDRMKTAREVYQELKDRLNKLEPSILESQLDYFSLSTKWDRPDTTDQPLPRYRRIVVYPVTGGSEGWYIHVDLHLDKESGRYFEIFPLMLGKTFEGWDEAWRVAKIIGKLMGV